jgi:hypothetical protein
MTREIGQTEQEQLEQLIDKFTLTQVLHALSDICYGKSEHLIRSNWQDTTAARDWERVARRIEVAENTANESFL